MTSGLVGEMGFKVLPDVSPLVTLLLTCLALLVGIQTRPQAIITLRLPLLTAESGQGVGE